MVPPDVPVHGSAPRRSVSATIDRTHKRTLSGVHSSVFVQIPWPLEAPTAHTAGVSFHVQMDVANVGLGGTPFKENHFASAALVQRPSAGSRSQLDSYFDTGNIYRFFHHLLSRFSRLPGLDWMFASYMQAKGFVRCARIFTANFGAIERVFRIGFRWYYPRSASLLGCWKTILHFHCLSFFCAIWDFRIWFRWFFPRSTSLLRNWKAIVHFLWLSFGA